MKASSLGPPVRITGTVSPTPITRAGESYAPDAVATYKHADGTIRASTGEPVTLNPPRIQRHSKALDTSTPVAGLLTILSVEAAPK